MNQNQKQDSLKEMMEILKGDYNAPVKLWVWGLCKSLHNPHTKGFKMFEMFVFSLRDK